MKKKLLTILVLMIPFFALAQKGSYMLKLVKVENDDISTGRITIDSIKPSKLIIYVGKYTDSLISASLQWGYSSINFELTNVSRKAIKINWNEAAYINYDNNTGKIMHLGVKYIDRNNEQPSTTIISQAKISDGATPTNNVYYANGSYGGWRTNTILPSVGKKDEKLLVGKKVKLLLPIVSDSKQINYVFTFEIMFNEYIK